MRNAAGWLREHKPEAEHSASLESFQMLIAGIDDAIGKPQGSFDWYRQGEFLGSIAGVKYLSDLDSSVERVRSTTRSKAWTVSSERGPPKPQV